MPRRSSKLSRKPNLKRAKNMVRKLHKSKAKRNMDTFFLKAKNMGVLSPTQGLTTSNYCYLNFTLDPTVPNYPLSFLSNAEFKLYASMYDKFRINTVKIRVTPKGNVLDLVNAQNDGAYTLTGDGMVHTCIDRDGSAPSNQAAISRYPSYRKYSILKRFTRSYSVKYPTGVWLDSQSPGTFSQAKELGLTGGITIYAENFLEDAGEIWNEPWAEVEVEYNIVFQGKTTANLGLSVDENGVETITITPHLPADNAPFSRVLNVRGTLAKDTRLVNQNADPATEDSITDKGNA